MFLGIKFEKKEWIWAILVISLITILTTLPYIHGFLTVKPGMHFLGMSYFNYDDITTYYAWIQQGLQGKIFFQQIYSPEAQPNIYFHPLFLSAGLIGRFFGASIIECYAGLRIFTTILFLTSSYLLISYFFSESYKRLYTLGLIGLGAGLGWLLGFPSADLNQFEFNNFLALYGSILNPFGMSIIILTVLLFLQRNLLSKKLFLFIYVVLAGSLLLVHPYDYMPLMVIIGVFSGIEIIRKKDFTPLGYLLYGIFFSFPFIVWQAFVILHNTPIAVWTFFQTGVAATKPIHYLAGIGFMLLFAMAGALLIFVEKKEKYYILITWLCLSLLFLFNPISDRFQRKLSIGITIPLIILACYALFEYTFDYKYKNKIIISRQFLLGAVFFVFILSNVLILKFGYDSNNASIGKPLNITDSEFAGLEWIKNNIPDRANIFCAPELGSIIPSFTGKTVFVAVSDQNTFFRDKIELSYAMLQSSIHASDPLLKYVKLNSIDYIVISSDISRYKDFNTDNRSYLKQVYTNPDIQIYEVN